VKVRLIALTRGRKERNVASTNRHDLICTNVEELGLLFTNFEVEQQA
jgi:hypothetical protein